MNWRDKVNLHNVKQKFEAMKFTLTIDSRPCKPRVWNPFSPWEYQSHLKTHWLNPAQSVTVYERGTGHPYRRCTTCGAVKRIETEENAA